MSGHNQSRNDQNVVASSVLMLFDTPYDSIRSKYAHSVDHSAGGRSLRLLKSAHLPPHQLWLHPIGGHFRTRFSKNKDPDPSGRSQCVYQSVGANPTRRGLGSG